MKKVFIGVLAALMLFAFTACDNNAGMAGLENMVTSIEVTSEVPSIFDGEAFDIDDYTITATRLDGSTFVVSADQLSVEEIEDVKFTEGEPAVVATAKYVGTTYSTVAPVNLYAEIYTLDDITVTGPSGREASYYGIPADKDFNKSAYTVTGVAQGTTATETLYSRVLTADEYTVATTLDSGSSNNVGSATATFTAKYGTSVTDNQTKVMIYADYIVDFAISAIDDYIAIIGDTPETDLSNYIELNVTYVSGKTENMALTSASTNGITIDWAENALTGTTSKVFGGNANIEAKKTINGQTVTRTATIVPENDYLVSFTVNYNRSVYVGGTVDAAGFTIASQTWASGNSTPVTEGVSSTLSVLVNGVTQFAIPSTVPANTNYPVEVTVVGQPQAGSVTQVVNVVENTAPVTPPLEEK